MEDLQECNRKRKDQNILIQELSIRDPEEYIKYEHIIIKVQRDIKVKVKQKQKNHK